MRRALIVGALLLLGGCAAPAPARSPTAQPEPGSIEPAPAHDPRLSWDVYAFDVGTGLSVLLRGPDFSMLYDGGSNDDRATGAANRVVAYLARLLGPSGEADCHPDAPTARPRLPLEHVWLSHPHRDHVNLLADVLRCYEVGDVWDSGKGAGAADYARFLQAVAQSPHTRYHSGADAPSAAIPASRTHRLMAGDRVELGREASAQVLHIDARARDPNDASIVLRVDLGRASVLLTGDLTAGVRAPPSAPPRPSSPEAALLRGASSPLDVDVLQVAHHGSLSSSRRVFLDAVSPAWAIVSSGPTRYGRVVLPDQQVIEALHEVGARVLRTDEDDEACAHSGDKVGPRNDGEPGGCTMASLHIDGLGNITVGPKLPPPLPGAAVRAEDLAAP